MTHLGGNRFTLKLRLDGEAKRYVALEVSFAYGAGDGNVGSSR